MSLDKIPTLITRYTLLSKIGEGGYGKVFLVEDKHNNKFAAKIPAESADNDRLRSEIAVMKSLSSMPNTSPFLTFYGTYSFNGLDCMVIEHFDGQPLTDIQQCARKGNRLPWEQLLTIAYDIFYGLNYLHERSMIHGDVHMSNVLYNKNRAVLIDIGGYSCDNYFLESEKPGVPYAMIFRTRDIYWNEISKGPVKLNKWIKNMDIYDAGMVLRCITTGKLDPDVHSFVTDPFVYRVELECKVLEVVINSCISIDLRSRPTVNECLEMLKGEQVF